MNTWTVQIEFPYGRLWFDVNFEYFGEGTVEMALRQVYKERFPSATSVLAWPS